MKKFFSLAVSTLLSLATLTSAAQTMVETPATVTAATVFLGGAELSFRGKVSVPAGPAQIVFTNVPARAQAATLQVTASAEITILSAAFSLNYLAAAPEQARVRALRDSVDILSQALKKIQGQRHVVKQQSEMLQANKSIVGENVGLSVDQLVRVYDYFSQKMNELMLADLELEQKEKKTSDRLKKLQQQLAEQNARLERPVGTVVLQVSSAAARNAEFFFSLFVPDASWKPVYDVRVRQVNEPVAFVYRAQVQQSTGVDWPQVRLTLSTGNPALSATGPVLRPWYLNIYVPPIQPLTHPDAQIRTRKEAAISLQADTVVSPITQALTAADFTSVVQTQLTTEFQIAVPYTIPSDGKAHHVTVQEFKLPATFYYYAIPKIDRDVFLVGTVTQWEELNLLPGQVHIYFKGSYVGHSFIHPHLTRDSLNFSLGRDPEVVVERTLAKEFSKKSLWSDQVRQTFAYTFTVRNNKSERIQLRVYDQYPISQNSRIEVQLEDASGALVDRIEGKLTWLFSLNPHESRTWRLAYMVKYPRNEIIDGL